MGADKLLGKGDMLMCRRDREADPCTRRAHHRSGNSKHRRFFARQGKPSYEMKFISNFQSPAPALKKKSGIDEDEAIIQQCIEVIRGEQAGVSLLQRRLRLGYGRAAQIMDELENRGIVGRTKAQNLGIFSSIWTELELTVRPPRPHSPPVEYQNPNARSSFASNFIMDRPQPGWI